jgi:hypothetical protein
MKIKILSSDIDNLQGLFNELLKYTLNLNESRFDIDSIEDPKELIYLQNKKTERYMAQFHSLSCIKNEIVNLSTKRSQLQEQLKLTELMLNSIDPISTDNEIVNPYLFIIDSDFNKLNNQCNSLEELVIVICFPDGEYVLIHLDSEASKLKAAQIICKYAKEMSEEDTVLDPEDYLEKTDLDFLEYLKIPLQNEIQIHNALVLQSLENELLEESWFVKYKVIFKIENIQSIIPQEEVFFKVYDLISHQIKDDSIEIIEFSTDEITGEDIHPNTSNLEIKLKRKLLEIFENELGFNQENDFLQRAYDLSNGEVEIELIEYSFPESDKLMSLK